MNEAKTPVPSAVRRIVAATDFSPAASAALEWATAIARSHRAALTLVHAVQLPPPPPDFTFTLPDVSAQVEKAARQRLDETARRLSEGGLEVDSDMLLGPPATVILDLAARREADLLVVGTRGLTGLAHLLLGSTAERIVQHARCPVLTVHPEAGEGRRPPGTILVPTDFSRDAELAVDAALRLLGPNRADGRLILLHATFLPVEYTAYGMVPVSIADFDQLAAEARRQLARIAEPLRRDGLTIDLEVREGYPPETIVKVATELEVDLIAMGTRGLSGLEHLLLGSTAERVVQRSACPVLTVRCGRPGG